MINISGYITGSDEDLVDSENFISINSCGYYKPVKLNFFETTRPDGRADFQLLYVAKGTANFRMDNVLHTLPEGSAIIYRPRQPQYYNYSLSDNPEIYWLHFSGARIARHLDDLGFCGKPWFAVGQKNEYIPVFEKIIRELQVRRAHFFELVNLYALELLALMARNMSEKNLNSQGVNEQIQNVIERMNRNSREKQSVNEYARLCNMSTCWFIHCFRAYTGTTPQQYITDIRICKAKELLSSSSFNITEIASIVGYDNPFYFSRIFKKSTGVAPKNYDRGNKIHNQLI